jgi:hypothetical protein
LSKRIDLEGLDRIRIDKKIRLDIASDSDSDDEENESQSDHEKKVALRFALGDFDDHPLVVMEEAKNQGNSEDEDDNAVPSLQANEEFVVRYK